MRVSVLQMCSVSDPDANLNSCEEAFDKAASESSELLVLPENVFAMGARFARLVETDWQYYIDALSKLCLKYRLPCIAGTIPVSDPDNSPKRFARSMYFDSEGLTKGQYDKIHLFDVEVGDEKGIYRESNYYSAGTTPMLVECGAAKIGLTVCFDLRFPNLFQVYRSLGANVIVVPSAFTALTGRKHWETLLRARAIETQSFILAPNQVGTHDDGRSTWGHTMIVSPDGEVLLDMERESGTRTVAIDLPLSDKIRRAMPLRSSLSC
jgi:nitrilase